MPTVMHGLLLASLLLLAAAAVHDVMVRTIPNWLAACLAVAGIALQAFHGTVLVGLPAALAVFLVAVLLWRRGCMGGGDVKLFGAVALLVPPTTIPALILAVSVAGGLLAIPYLLARRRIGVPRAPPVATLLARIIRTERWRLRRGGPLPYAVAIAGGTIVAIANGGSF